MGDDVEDGEASTSQEALLKRRRFDTTNNEPMNIDISQLNGKFTHRPALNNNNRFSILGDLEIESDNAAALASDRSKLKNSSKTVNNPTRTTFCPPIFLYNVNIKLLVDQLQARTPKINFKVKNVNKNKSKLYISDSSVHTEMMALLKEKKVNSYSFTPKELRQTSLIIRGLYAGTEAKDIKEAMDGVVANVVANVSRFSTAFSLKNKFDTGLFLITLLPGKGLGDVSHIKYLLSQSIVWEKPKKKDQEIQCRNCQRWGHIARNCNREFKCVKCDKTHKPGDCGRKEDDDSQPCCVNCGIVVHPANWRGCEAYRKYVSDKKARMNDAREKKLIAANNVNKVIRSSRVNQGQSYASFFQTQDSAPVNPNKKPPIIGEFMKLAHYFMEPEELSLEHEIQKFLDNYRNMPKSVAKTEFLLLLNKVRNSYGP